MASATGPNTEVHIPTDDGEHRTVNNFEKLSFNVGPTLMAWMEKAHPDTHARIVEADRASVEHTGHGNAIAQAFHHTILPLSTTRDIRTQVRWGLFDFRHRFGQQYVICRGVPAGKATLLGAPVDRRRTVRRERHVRPDRHRGRPSAASPARRSTSPGSCGPPRSAILPATTTCGSTD